MLEGQLADAVGGERVGDAQHQAGQHSEQDRGDQLSAQHQWMPIGATMAMSISLISTNGVISPPTP